ncbi:MAG: Gfo/Idh/MocA family oxidoreductase [Phycisphaerae bacterium]
MKTKTKIGVVGCGNICAAYFSMARNFEILELAACADLDPDRAKAKASEFNIPRVCSVKDLMADPDIEIILNLTIPKAHAEIAFQAIEAGKSVYNEKPLSVTRDEGLKILQLAKAKGVRVGAAPDTFLGAGLQTCRKLIDDGWIGRPVAATAFMMCHGHERWHPAPDFYYQVGGGPMFDMGPYYLTALINLLGPVRRVTGSAQITFPERTITSQPNAGTKIKVETPTHLVGVLDFASGAVVTLTTSFDVWEHDLPCIEIFGTEGSLKVPDPNTFGGPVLIRRPGDKEWVQIPLTHKYEKNYRSIGLADLACAQRAGRPHRANGDMAYHVLDIMHAVLETSREGRHIDLASTCDRPAPLPMHLPEGVLDG